MLPSSPDALRRRLEERAKESAEEVEVRLRTAQQEILSVTDYDYLVVNDHLEEAEQELSAILVANRCRIGYRESLQEIWRGHFLGSS